MDTKRLEANSNYFPKQLFRLVLTGLEKSSLRKTKQRLRETTVNGCVFTMSGLRPGKWVAEGVQGVGG